MSRKSVFSVSWDMRFPFTKLFAPLTLPPRFRYQDPAFLKALHAAVQLLYLPESRVRTGLLQLPVVHALLTQHSLFLPSLLKSEEEGDPDNHVKGAPRPLPCRWWFLILGSLGTAARRPHVCSVKERSRRAWDAVCLSNPSSGELSCGVGPGAKARSGSPQSPYGLTAASCVRIRI